jgi:hypothetical protein
MRFKKRHAPQLLLCIICLGLAMSMFQSAKAQQIVLSPNLPVDVTVPNPRQSDFDTFSWQSFVALNWPALSNGTPDTSATIGEDPGATPVWQFYYDPVDVFLPDGAQPPDPADYPIEQTIPSPCQSSTVNGGAGQRNRMKVVRQFTKSGDVEDLPRNFLEATEQPLVDQAGNYVVFEVRINRDEYTYIFTNQLYDATIQASTPAIDFPAGASPFGPVGAMELKAAWRVFPPDIPASTMARYFTTPALIFIPAQFSHSGSDLCLNATLGLVGLHIIHKTGTRPQWIWSTFEQIDNVPGENGGAVFATFNNPHAAQPQCPNIVAPDPQYLWQADQPFAVNQDGVNQPPTQVLRCTPIQASAELNQDWQNALKAVNPESPWQYYQLVSTQWPTNPTDTQGNGDPTPLQLANTVLETYIQQSNFSCIPCHSTAMTTANRPADFSFMLSLAQSSQGTDAGGERIRSTARGERIRSTYRRR